MFNLENFLIGTVLGAAAILIFLGWVQVVIEAYKHPSILLVGAVLLIVSGIAYCLHIPGRDE